MKRNVTSLTSSTNLKNSGKSKTSATQRADNQKQKQKQPANAFYAACVTQSRRAIRSSTALQREEGSTWYFLSPGETSSTLIGTEIQVESQASRRLHQEVEDGFYLPHHAVFKETSLTTKTRVVFDGSARSSTGVSLNETLMVGPTVKDDILSLVLRFRLHNYIFTGDIEKMYRQGLIRPEDTKYQRILWREHETINTYELQSVTFGLSSASFLAVRCLDQLADDESEQYPLAASRLKRDLYVDDLLTWTSTLEEAILRNEMICLLRTGGFALRQCTSNSPQIIQGLPESTINLQLLGGDDPTLKTLGIHWDSQSGSIVYPVNPIATRDVITMRTIASDVARIFDPLDLLNPVKTHAIIIQQELWRLKLHWDDSTPTEVHTRRTEFASQLPLLNKIKFQRQVTSRLQEKLEVYGLCDASQSADGASIYLKTTKCTGQSHHPSPGAVCNGTPPKPVRHSEEVNITPQREVLWSGSTVALHWIKISPHLLQRFVANRVSRIQDLTNNVGWKHVRTHDNPAGAVSRGELASDFLKNELWLHGPAWRRQPEEHSHLLKTLKELPELKRATCLHITEPAKSPFLHQYLSFEKLQRITARCLRWKKRFPHYHLTLQELQKAEIRILQLIQQEGFHIELSPLQQGKPLPSKTRLNNLNPQLDETGLIRVGGRLQKACDIPLDSKHPKLLPRSRYITHLIIQRTHLLNLHAGVQTTLHLLSQRYWPIGGRNQVRLVIHKCLNCAKVNPTPVTYQMANHPNQTLYSHRIRLLWSISYQGQTISQYQKDQNLDLYICLLPYTGRAHRISS
ncbi:uncharacterized protein LOC135169140 [Diachasmimorpha longicaudata]|uniref:uncharacterized protein LOC135169140 n=1 Tax=Diachasmimorpha longicaudata TaxID=58733 RepID=UPI0030B8855F